MKIPKIIEGVKKMSANKMNSFENKLRRSFDKKFIFEKLKLNGVKLYRERKLKQLKIWIILNFFDYSPIIYPQCNYNLLIHNYLEPVQKWFF